MIQGMSRTPSRGTQPIQDRVVRAAVRVFCPWEAMLPKLLVLLPVVQVTLGFFVLFWLFFTLGVFVFKLVFVVHLRNRH